ncbi:hypothetical protein C1H46_015384 [Malus baccata]|uniref:Uncharacterized protein n=1 Tax=Malus baccata TaxID=106549 RepID=A0A540MJQ1_MALBA|nr:hypothetical protein C1H46_015384 [Malus baccata]
MFDGILNHQEQDSYVPFLAQNLNMIDMFSARFTNIMHNVIYEMPTSNTSNRRISQSQKPNSNAGKQFIPDATPNNKLKPNERKIFK